ncbi:MAG TPA: nitrilase-related carbon-nitrogen hydrolase, partial [Gemmatimonadaceae bacterium]|nr:nitrilase-related carbon-nitrogen hydrolase [Gemmatimonadaceae bacterium]
MTRIALGQLAVRAADPAANLAAVAAVAARAGSEGADLLLLPEMWATGLDLADAPRLAAEVRRLVLPALPALARRHRLHLAGSLPVADRTGAVFNTFVVVPPDGPATAVYRKVHLFSPWQEHRFVRGGHRAATCAFPWGDAGIGICYDIRFPELFRLHALAGATHLLVSALWGAERVEHWRVLLRARAVENQCWVVACGGVDPARGAYAGRSTVVDPWGEVTCELGDGEDVALATIDLAAVAAARARLPALADRRPAVYHRPPRRVRPGGGAPAGADPPPPGPL